MSSSLDFALGGMTSIPSMPAVETVTATAAPTAVAGSVIGDNTNTAPPPASATVMIVIGVVLGILGVATVVTVIWWMRKRAIANQVAASMLPPPSGYRSAPPPPPKSAGAGQTSKALPQINVASANAYRPGQPSRSARSGTVDSLDKDKALPMKPVESVWTSPTGRNKSPALASVHELKSQSPRRPHDLEMGMGRNRSDSLEKEATDPANFL